MRNIDLGFFPLSHLGFFIFIEWQRCLLAVEKATSSNSEKIALNLENKDLRYYET